MALYKYVVLSVCFGGTIFSGQKMALYKYVVVTSFAGGNILWLIQEYLLQDL
ncbi:MAG: hypothetical protein ACRCXA_06625 [Peptostreptococcaceae bacterium]